MNAVMDVERTTKRVLAPVSAAAIASLTLLSLVLAYRLLPADSYRPPLGDYGAPLVLNRVPGIDGPAAHQGEVISLRGERCHNRKAQTSTSVYWTKEDSSRSAPGDKDIINPGSEGCMSYNLSLQMPEAVGPGRWVVSGIVREVGSGEVRYWSTQQLQVVP